MKKLLVIIIILFSIYGCKNYIKNENNISLNNKSNNDVVITGNNNILFKHDDIEIRSTFPSEQIDQFKKQLENYKSEENLSESEIVELARLYDYTGKTGKALLLYEKYYGVGEVSSFPIYNNITKLYDKICIYNIQDYYQYCTKAVENYFNIIKTFDSIVTYKDLCWTLIHMGEIQRAKGVYKLYKNKGGKGDSTLEQKLKI